MEKGYIEWVECKGRWPKPIINTEILLTVKLLGEKASVITGSWNGKEFVSNGLLLSASQEVIAYAYKPHPFVGEEIDDLI